MMKQTIFLFLFSLLSLTQLQASLDTCYQIVEVVSNTSSLELDQQITLDFNASSFMVSDESYALTNIENYKTGSKKSIILYYDCLYPFDRFEETGIFTASTLIVDGLGEVIVCTHHQSDIAYLIVNGESYLVVPCGIEDSCISPRYVQPILATVDYTLVAISQGEEYSISPPMFELVTEQHLMQDAHSILTTVDPVFELVTEQRVDLYTNLCPDIETIPMVVQEEVLVQESSNVLTVYPAEFEIVTEEVLETYYHTNVELVSVPNWSQTQQVSIVPEYFSYNWIGQPTCLSQNPYDCVEVYTSQSNEQFEEIDPPTEWNCDQDVEFGEEMILVSEVPSTYSKRSYFKLTKPATTESTQIPAETKVRTYTTFENLEEIPDSCIQITYITDTLYRLMTPATTISQEVPAVYETRQYLRVIQDGTYEVETPQNQCQLEFQGQQLIRPAQTYFEDYLCEITDIARQEAIKLTLYQAGNLDDLNVEYGSGEFWIALFDFQVRRNNWDIGPLTESQAAFLDRP